MISTTEDTHHQQQQYQHPHLSEPLSDPLLLPDTAPRPRRDTFSPQQDNLYPFLRTPPDRHITDIASTTAVHTTIPTTSSTMHTSAGPTAGSSATTGTSSAVLKPSAAMVDRNKSHYSSALFKEHSSSQKNILPSPIHPPPRTTLSLTSSTHPYTHTKVSIPSKRWLPNPSGHNQPLIKELQYVLKQRNNSTPTATTPTYMTPTDGTSPINTTTNTTVHTNPTHHNITNTTSRSNMEEYEHTDSVYNNRAAVLNHLSVGNPYYRNLRNRLHTHALTATTSGTSTSTTAASSTGTNTTATTTRPTSGTGTTTVSAATTDTTVVGGELVSNSRDNITNFSYTIHSPKQQQQEVPLLHAQHDYIDLSNHNTTTTISTLPQQQQQQYKGIELIESDSEDKYKTAPNSV